MWFWATKLLTTSLVRSLEVKPGPSCELQWYRAKTQAWSRGKGHRVLNHWALIYVLRVLGSNKVVRVEVIGEGWRQWGFEVKLEGNFSEVDALWRVSKLAIVEVDGKVGFKPWLFLLLRLI
jgi:hypothetical protein